MSWLEIPPKMQKTFAKNLVRIACDMEKFVCLDFRVSLRLIRDM